MKQKEKEPKESQTLFRLLFENMSSGVVIYETHNDGKDFIIKDCNKAAEKIEKIKREKIIGKNVLRVFPGIIKFGLFDVFRRVWKTGKPEILPVSLYHDKRITGWKENYVFKITDNEIVAIYNDITERKKAEEELKESEDRYKFLVDRMQEIAIILNKSGKVIFANNFALKTLGYTEKEILGKSVFRILTKDSIKKSIYALGQEFLGKPQGAMEVEIKTKKGEIRTIALGEASNPIYKDKHITELLVNGTDITDRKKAEEALRENEYFTEESQKAAFIGSYKTDFISGKWRSSEVLDMIFGIDKDYNRSIKGWLDVVHPDDKKMMDRYLREDVIAKRKSFEKEYRITRKSDGETRWVNGLGKMSFDKKGNPLIMIGTIQDITERKKIEEEINNSKKLLQRIINLLPIRIFWKDKDLKFLGCNYIFAKDAGKSRPDELIGKDDFQMNWKEQAKSYREDDQKVMKSGKPKLDFEETQTTPKGDTIWVKTSKMPLTDSEGITIGILGEYEDITERKKAEEKLHDSEAKYRAILDYSSDQIFIIDKNLRFTSVNNFVSKALGRKPEDIINKPLKDVFTRPEELARFSSNIKKSLGGESQRIEEEIIFQDKKNYISTQLNPIRDSSGEITAVLGIARNITDRKNTEEELKKSKDILISKVDELERFNKIVIDRELKMIELKEKIKKLEEKLGQK